VSANKWKALIIYEILDIDINLIRGFKTVNNSFDIKNFSSMNRLFYSTS